uniref:Uncharacterized protein n=1 Tax=Knipowitschia caucasica TaxID=637954 RepID=A0AAV2L820_KNICA
MRDRPPNTKSSTKNAKQAALPDAVSQKRPAPPSPVIQGPTGAYKEIQGDTRRYRDLQESTGIHRGLQGDTRRYRDLQGPITAPLWLWIAGSREGLTTVLSGHLRAP